MAEKEYIDRGELVDFLKQDIAKCEEEFDNSFGDECYDQAVKSRMTAMLGVLRRITTQPSADVVEVVHGTWVKKFKIIPLYGDRQLRGTFPVCSKCNFIHAAEASVPLNYCPNCGAKMDIGEAT